MTRIAYLFGLVIVASNAVAQGPLEPGQSPAPGMRTLLQIEPRTPISSLPYDIDQPGSYYVTGPLYTTNNRGITVMSSHVTVDLMGFTITGSQNTNGHGVHILGGEDVMLRNVVVKNGGITQFGYGVLVNNAIGGVLRDLVIYENIAEGIMIRNKAPGICADFTVEHNVITDNGASGIFISGAGNDGGNRTHTIRNNKISGNLEHGVFMTFSRGCLVEGNHFGPQRLSSMTNAYAVRSGNSRNFIFRNVEIGNSNVFGNAYFAAPSADTLGPTINETGYLSHTNREVHPWSNFSR